MQEVHFQASGPSRTSVYLVACVGLYIVIVCTSTHPVVMAADTSRTGRSTSNQLCPHLLDPTCECFPSEDTIELHCEERQLDTAPDFSPYRGGGDGTGAGGGDTGSGEGVPISFLTLDDNLITQLPARWLDGLSFHSLSLANHPVIHLSDNNLQVISDTAFSGINAAALGINMANCNLRNIPFDALGAFPNFTMFMFQNNDISDIPDGALGRFKKLKSLNIGRNVITNINRVGVLRGLESVLETLDMASMEIRRFPVELVRNLKKLRRIDLSANRIAELQSELFKDFSTVARLEIKLERNNISDVSDAVFTNPGSTRLARLDLDVNHIRAISFIDSCSNALSAESSSSTAPEVSLVDNPLECDCAALTYIQPSKVTLRGSCHTPAHYRNLVLYNTRSDADFYRNATDMCAVQPLVCAATCVLNAGIVWIVISVYFVFYML